MTALSSPPAGANATNPAGELRIKLCDADGRILRLLDAAGAELALKDQRVIEVRRNGRLRYLRLTEKANAGEFSLDEVRVEVRRPDGSLLRRAGQREAELLIAGGLATPKLSRSGEIRYVLLRQGPSPKGYARTVAEASITTVGHRDCDQKHKGNRRLFR